MTTGGMMETIHGKLFNGTELDIRTEISELFSGIDFSEEKGIIFIHRKLIRDSKNKRIKCSCNSGANVGGQKDCPYCDGIGYKWEELFIKSYLYNKRYISFTSSFSFVKSQARAFNEQYIFITEHTNKIEEGDHIFELKKDVDGKIITPFVIDIDFLITANKYMSMVRNIGEYTLAVGEIVNRNDYVDARTYQ